MNNPCGNQRCEQKGQLPFHAWRLNNELPIRDNEILIELSKIHLENGNFNQIFNECDGDDEKMKEQIMTIVDLRHKLHNPYTGTGGIVCGRIKEIGQNCHLTDIEIGDEVLVPISATLIPTHIDRVKSIDIICGHIDVEGYAILYDGCNLVKYVDNISWDTMMCCFEESASIHRNIELARDKENVLIIGSNPLILALYSMAVGDSIKPNGTVVAVLFNDFLSDAYEGTGQKRNKIAYSIFDEVYRTNGKTEVEIVDEITQDGARLFDLVINCSDQTGAEAISVFSTKPGGTIFFSNLTNNYAIALFLQEGISRPMTLECAAGYVEGYEKIMIDFLRKHKAELRTLEKKLDEVRTLKRREYSSETKNRTIDVLMGALHAVSPSMRKVSEIIYKTSKFDCNVILTGESGTGKELVANTIYKMSDRNGGPIVKVNCAAIPRDLIESEFFGYEKGAFTGASSSGKAGLLEMADKGVLFLDEIADMPLDMQAKLLRVIQEGEFYRIGGSTPVTVNVRFLAATNKPIKELIAQGKFREDLFYRLSVVEISLPSLRSRSEDIPVLTEYFLRKYNEKYGSNCQIAQPAIKMMSQYRWPGNVRELENFIQKLIIASYGKDESLITTTTVLKITGDRKEKGESGASDEEGKTFAEKVEALEKKLIREALEKRGSTYKAAEELGMTQSQLMRKKQKYNI